MTLVCVIAATVIFIIGLFAVIADRQAEIDRLKAEAERAGRERDAAEVERDIANALVEQWRRDARVVRPLRVVPAQRDGSEWPAIMRAVEGEVGE